MSHFNDLAAIAKSPIPRGLGQGADKVIQV
jgi:hypothetical protein